METWCSALLFTGSDFGHFNENESPTPSAADPEVMLLLLLLFEPSCCSAYQQFPTVSILSAGLLAPVPPTSPSQPSDSFIHLFIYLTQLPPGVCRYQENLILSECNFFSLMLQEPATPSQRHSYFKAWFSVEAPGPTRALPPVVAS